jgi:hypothetical protein
MLQALCAAALAGVLFLCLDQGFILARQALGGGVHT